MKDIFFTTSLRYLSYGSPDTEGVIRGAFGLMLSFVGIGGIIGVTLGLRGMGMIID